MKIRNKLLSALTTTAVALACLTPRAQAQTILADYTNTFPNNGNMGFYPAPSFNYWYSIYQDVPGGGAQGDYNLQGTNDAGTDFTGDTNDSGSMYVSAPWGNPYFTTHTDQNVFRFTLADDGPYDNSQQMEVLIITNLSWEIHVDPASVPDANGNFGTLASGFLDLKYSLHTLDYLTIPGSATNGWVKMSETNISEFEDIANAIATAETNTPANSMVWSVGFDQNSYYPNYPSNTLNYWIDNVVINTSTAPPPPPPPPAMTIAPAFAGLNLFTGVGSALYNREDLQATQNSFSWVGASAPESFSFTITNYPVGTNDAVQVQIFLCPNPGTENDPDWNEPSIIFMDLESDVPNGGGAQWNFRYKTNEPNGNTMIYGVGTLASIGTNTAIGTWTLTFNNDTNVTMTIPGGASTNFNIPDATGATAALFSSGVSLYFGAQAGNVGGANDHVVVSDFKVTGSQGDDFEDNFVTDAGVLNANDWMVNAAYPATVQMVAQGNPYWISWTEPAIGYALVTSPSLSDADWSPATNHNPVIAGTGEHQLVSTNDVQPGQAAYFSLVQRTFSKLLILLPGEVSAPNTPTGKTGTPTPVSLGNNNNETFTVLAVDDKFYPVPDITDTIAITSSDSNASLPTGNPVLANGSVIVNDFYFGTTGPQTITATDQTTSSIQAATSSSVTVGP